MYSAVEIKAVRKALDIKAGSGQTFSDPVVNVLNESTYGNATGMKVETKGGGTAANFINEGSGGTVFAKNDGIGNAVYGYSASGIAGYFVSGADDKPGLYTDGARMGGTGAPIIKTYYSYGTTDSSGDADISTNLLNKTPLLMSVMLRRVGNNFYENGAWTDVSGYYVFRPGQCEYYYTTGHVKIDAPKNEFANDYYEFFMIYMEPTH
jgi:hypothetical protein